LLRGGRPYPPSSLEELEVLPGAIDAIKMLRQAGFLVVVVTNQPDVGAGTQKREIVEAINDRIRHLTGPDEIKTCYHRDQDGCACRKPKPGMLLEVARERSVALEGSFMVGDRWRDIGAGRAAGCRTILVGDGYGEAFADAPDAVVASLLEASRLVLSNSFTHGGSRDKTR
jgi:D-glycero-D-manno-heptose 1,7-bisphosphate phosphatase